MARDMLYLGARFRLAVFFFGFFLPPRAVLSAIATACFCGRPDARNSLMFFDIVALLFPFFSGITVPYLRFRCSVFFFAFGFGFFLFLARSDGVCAGMIISYDLGARLIISSFDSMSLMFHVAHWQAGLFIAISCLSPSVLGSPLTQL